MCYIACDGCLKMIIDDDYLWFIHPDNPYRIIKLHGENYLVAWENRHDEEPDR